MTLRVYRVNADGAVTEVRGTLNVKGTETPLPLTDQYPPCTCPRHRAGQAVPQ
ncbi:hypothetical protein GCM10010377_82660 [Streptomyces viridiviolaceus]|nr:hypothetical protein GCM10010377_82660 [Streptomyces viridiviolaceus]